MSHNPCFETICIENRELKNLEFHQERFNRTRQQLWGCDGIVDLKKILIVPDYVDENIHKCRVSFDQKVLEIKWEPYAARTIRNLKKIHTAEIDYSYKYENRTALNILFSQRGEADEILIIKNGMVTDTSIGNVAFFDGNQWFTPKTCLLPGTRRAHLLNAGIIFERDISEKDISKYSKIKLFNAMNDWERATVLDVACII